MAVITILGKLGKDVELKDFNGTALAKFSVAENVGFGEKKQTIWYDVSIWGKQAQSNFVDYLKKGQMVQVVGELTIREYNGKTYLEVRSFTCNLAGSSGGAGQNNPNINYEKQTVSHSQNKDLDDDLPF